MHEAMIDVRIPSDIAVLREVLVGLVKPFTLEDLIVEAQDEVDPRRRARPMVEVLARYSVQAPDAALATIQHERLVAVLAQHGVTLHWVEPADVCIQLYTRDMGFGIDDVFFRSRPATVIRRREQAGLAWLLPRLSKVCELSDGHIEGGVVIVTDDDVLVGIGDSTNADGVESLRRALPPKASTGASCRSNSRTRAWSTSTFISRWPDHRSPCATRRHSPLIAVPTSNPASTSSR